MLTCRRAGNPWSILGLDPGASRDEIKRAFRERIRKAHPDAGGSAEQFKQVRDAYQAALQRSGLGTGTGGQSGQAAQQPEHAGWSINDFYKWRREQVREEREKWEDDSNFEDPRRWWAGGGDRQRSQQRASWSEDGSVRGRKAAAQRSRPRKPSYSERHFRDRHEDLSRLEWDHFLKGRNKADADEERKRAAAARGPRGKRRHRALDEKDDEGPVDPITGHRTVATLKGSVRVPVFKAPEGGLYYVSPLTSKKVSLPS
eukprot:gb/GFBE01076089.1/.p1 GENE.gb/GFBE01076089.1/~~gb/GFBE01076089.1/.p1  ORF type:complete len:258 (+),score=40.05 gb/GFBE01076089.1/:1-774(+)